MRRTSLFAFLVVAILATSARAQVGSPGIEYGNTIAAGDGVQLYPYDQQDTWLHGHFQRVPSYGGFSSFRPYNYRHVFAQTQLAQQWGHTHGMPYSQQFWNRYRGSYLDGNLHADSQPVIQNPQPPGYPTQTNQQQQFPDQQHYAQPFSAQAYSTQSIPGNSYPVSAVRPIGYATQDELRQATQEFSGPRNGSDPAERPIHIFPERMNQR